MTWGILMFLPSVSDPFRLLRWAQSPVTLCSLGHILVLHLSQIRTLSLDMGPGANCCRQGASSSGHSWTLCVGAVPHKKGLQYCAKSECPRNLPASGGGQGIQRGYGYFSVGQA